MPSPLHTYILNIYDLIWFGWDLCHINPCRLFNAKFSLYIYNEYIWFGLVGFYGTSTIVGYLMPNLLYIYIKCTWFGLVGFCGISTIVGYLMSSPLYTYILNIYDLIWFGWDLCHINPCRLFNAKSSLYIYNEYIWFGLVEFYGISTIVADLALRVPQMVLCLAN